MRARTASCLKNKRCMDATTGPLLTSYRLSETHQVCNHAASFPAQLPKTKHAMLKGTGATLITSFAALAAARAAPKPRLFYNHHLKVVGHAGTHSKAPLQLWLLLKTPLF